MRAEAAGVTAAGVAAAAAIRRADRSPAPAPTWAPTTTKTSRSSAGFGHKGNDEGPPAAGAEGPRPHLGWPSPPPTRRLPKHRQRGSAEGWANPNGSRALALAAGGLPSSPVAEASAKRGTARAGRTGGGARGRP